MIVFGDNDDQRRVCLTLEETNNKEYNFRKEDVPRLFNQALKLGRLTLPPPSRPRQAHLTIYLNFHYYHRCVNHKIEDYFSFKDWLEDVVKKGIFSFSAKLLGKSQKLKATKCAEL